MDTKLNILDLYKSILKLISFPSAVWESADGFSPNNIIGNYQFDRILGAQEFLKKNIRGITIPQLDPIIWNCSLENITHVAVIPFYGQQNRQSFILFFINAPSDNSKDIKSTELWHDINNPLTILSMLLSRLNNKTYLDQEDINKLLTKSHEISQRIEKVIKNLIT